MPGPTDDPVLILTGPPGAGKTTSAAILAERSERAVHLEADVFFRFIRAGHVEPWKPESHKQNEVVMRIVAAAAAGYATAGYFTIVDGIVIPGWFFEPLRDALADAGHPVALAVLRAPLATCLERLQRREGDPPIDAGANARLWESFADLGDLETNGIDVDGMTSEKVADEIGRRLSDGLLRV